MMKRFLPILACLALSLSLHASTIITGSLTLTNSANITGTNALETITVNADVRTWTNSVHTAATQILASTNSSTAFARLVTHFAAYPVTGLQFFSDGISKVSWRAAADTALTITLGTNNWGSVSYTTNTVYAGTPIKLLYTTSALSASSSTNYIPSFEGTDIQTITASGAVNLLQTTNRPSLGARTIIVKINPNGSTRALSFGPTWWWLTDKPTGATNGSIVFVSLFSDSTVETNVIATATYAVPQ